MAVNGSAPEAAVAFLEAKTPERWVEEACGRLAELKAVESELVVTPDPEFRFHSGVPLQE